MRQELEIHLVYTGWIKCDGIEVCSDGIYKGQSCSDMSNRALMGATSDEELLRQYNASIPDHQHYHSHTTASHSHTDSGHSHSYKRGPSNVRTEESSDKGHAWTLAGAHDHKTSATTGTSKGKNTKIMNIETIYALFQLI